MEICGIVFAVSDPGITKFTLSSVGTAIYVYTNTIININPPFVYLELSDRKGNETIVSQYENLCKM